jgi:hypothetical protein
VASVLVSRCASLDGQEQKGKELMSAGARLRRELSLSFNAMREDEIYSNYRKMLELIFDILPPVEKSLKRRRNIKILS